jgi:hypothetical protein
MSCHESLGTGASVLINNAHPISELLENLYLTPEARLSFNMLQHHIWREHLPKWNGKKVALSY